MSNEKSTGNPFGGFNGLPQQGQGFPQQASTQQGQGFPPQGFQQQGQGFTQQGSSTEQTGQATHQAKSSTDNINTTALISIVLASLGIILTLFGGGFLGAILGVVGLSLGLGARHQISTTGEKGDILALLAIIFSVIVLILFAVGLILGILMVIGASMMY